jgi:chlorite dismutase
MSAMRTYRPDLAAEEQEAFDRRRQEDVNKPRQFVNFAFYKVSAEYLRTRTDAERAEAVEEFASVIEAASKTFLIYPYSTQGIRRETDFLLWRISYRLEDFQELTSAMLKTSLGKYLETPYSFLSMTGTSIYVSEHDIGTDETRNKIVIGGGKYVFVYPFVKVRPWYVLSAEERMGSMREHIRVGHKYPSVKLNTTYSFGLDDQDFVLAFESDYPQDFLDLVKELRETNASTYTERDTPIFTCIKQDLRTMLAHVSGVPAACTKERK